MPFVNPLARPYTHCMEIPQSNEIHENEEISPPEIIAPYLVANEIEKMEQEIFELEEKLAQKPTGSELRKLNNSLGLKRGQLKRLEEGNIGRHIPEAIASAVQERDRGRNFGRPDHNCEKPGPPHHIIHYAEFTGAHTRETPHTLQNLEAPCGDCHKLAHALNIPSGISIQAFFEGIPSNKWLEIKDLWSRKANGELSKILK